MTARHPILFCCTHSTGEATTSLVLAGELARRGVPDLVFAADDNLRGAVDELAAATGVTFVPMGPVNPELALTMIDDEAYARIHQRSRVRGMRARARQLFGVDHLLERIARMEEVVADVRPSLMVVNRFATHAIVVAMRHDIPFVITAPCLPSSLLEHDLPRGFPRPSSGLPLRRTWRQRLAHAWFAVGTGTLFLDRTIARQAVRLHRGLKELGIDPGSLRVPAQNAAARSLLCFSVPEIDYSLPTPEVHMLGALVPPVERDPRDDGLHAFLDAHPSSVYVAFGSITRMTAEQVGAMVEVARRLGGEQDDLGVLWVLRADQQRFLPDDLPSNLRVVDWVHSQHAVLAHSHVRAFFTHGGSNSVHESLWFDTPVLVRPTNVDQYDHAVRAVDTGVGLAVERPDRVDVEEIVGKLRRLVGTTWFTTRARRFGELQRAAGGLDRAADLVLDEVPDQSSRRAAPSSNAGRHTATYSAPSGPGEL